jgi:hypothetical protein
VEVGAEAPVAGALRAVRDKVVAQVVALPVTASSSPRPDLEQNLLDLI